jgi:hypothetical protein
MNELELAAGTAIITALIAILIGIANCFFGYRIFRILLGILGFIGGALAGLVIIQALVLGGSISSSGALLYYILAALVGGAIGAVLLIFVYFIGVFLLGAAAGFVIGYVAALALNANDDVALIAAVVLALAGGILALILQRVIIIIATAISGALYIVSGIAALVSPALVTRTMSGQTPAIDTAFTIMLIGWVVLSIAGMVVQFVWTGKKKPQPAPAVAGAPPQVIVQQYGVAPAQSAPPVQQPQPAPPPVVQSQPMAAPPPPVVPTAPQPAPQAPPPMSAPPQPYVPPMPAPEEEAPSFPAPAAGESKFCPNCGQPVAYGTTFCTNCGNSVGHLWQ